MPPLLAVVAALLLAARGNAQEQPTRAARVIAHLQDTKVSESSGVVASRLNPGIYWTHNDSGDAAVLYAFDRNGRSHGRWRVTGAQAVDWEDIAAGPGPKRGRRYLYAGDIGNNTRRRREVTVYRVEEPRTGQCRGDCATARAAAIRLRYPDGPHDAEALLVHPATGDLYIISKAGHGDPEARVYKARAPHAAGVAITLARVATLAVQETLFAALIGGITGGDISPDGKRVVLCDYFRAYEAQLPPGKPFDAIWTREFQALPIGIGLQVEGICYRADGKAIIATSEGRPCPVFEIAPAGRTAASLLMGAGRPLFAGHFWPNLNVSPAITVSGYPGVPWILATAGAAGAARDTK